MICLMAISYGDWYFISWFNCMETDIEFEDLKDLRLYSKEAILDICQSLIQKNQILMNEKHAT